MTTTWHLLTSEYPPASGGVGDYTHSLARELARRGDDVHVWCPVIRSAEGADRVHLHALPDSFGRRSRKALTKGWRALPGTVLLQYVPNALGARGVNVPFCWWLRRMSRATDVRVMFHEPYFYFSWDPIGNVRAVAQRLMARLLVRASRVVYLSTETWARYLQPFATAATRMIVVPVPSAIPSESNAAAVAQWRARVDRLGRAEIVGHFGTYGDHVGGELESMVPLLLAERSTAQFVCIGRGGKRFATRLRERHPDLASRIHATGGLSASEVGAALRACDVVAQPYPDGVTTRRTSVMASLANGVPTVSTRGALTERVWGDSDGVALAPVGDAVALAAAIVRLLEDDGARTALGHSGRVLYESHFAIGKSVDALLGASVTPR